MNEHHIYIASISCGTRSNVLYIVRPSFKKIVCLGKPEPTLPNKNDLKFLEQNGIFVFVFHCFYAFVAVLTGNVKKNSMPTLPNFFETVALNTHFFLP